MSTKSLFAFVFLVVICFLEADGRQHPGAENPITQNRAKKRGMLGPRNPSTLLIGEVKEAWVSHYASGLAPAHDVATAVVTDARGNVVVTGFSSSEPFGVDYLTTKYDANGVELWTARFNGDGSGDDFASALGMDFSGNVFVTGKSWSGSSFDYATVKYSSNGVKEWSISYNGPSDSNDNPAALAVDSLGNVYITGGSWALGTSLDFATVKYSSQGTEQWVARYSGSANSDDQATAIVVDPSGNVYVTGTGRESGLNDDFVTIKYDTDGEEHWIAIYMASETSNDRAADIAVDRVGNVYVTGAAAGDYATIKYSTAGDQEWIALYNGPGNSVDRAIDLVIDSLDAIYVTGESAGSGTGSDLATIKYDGAGVEQWAMRYNGSGDSTDVPTAIAIDSSGNVYVGGTGYEVDSHEDFVTIKYSSAGVEQWTKIHDGSGNSSDTIADLVLDPLGNVVVTGRSLSSTTGEDFATIKYGSVGAEQWVVRYDGVQTSSDKAVDLALDGFGHLVVTGTSRGFLTSQDYATVMYDLSGVELWTTRYNGLGNSSDESSALAVDSSGNIFVTGKSKGSAGNWDYTTIKYNNFGVEQWIARYDGSGGMNDEATALAVDGLGNAYVTGRSWNSAGHWDFATIKYTNSGVERWVVRYNGLANSNDESQVIAVDDSANVYVSGNSVGLSTNDDYTTIKYDSSGSQQWIARYDGLAASYDRPTNLMVDEHGNVYVTGRIRKISFRTTRDLDYATVKYSWGGVQQWAKRHNGQASNQDVATGLVLDASENVIITGYSTSFEIFGFPFYYDYTTIKYNSDGIEQWAAGYIPDGNNVAADISVDLHDNVYVTGSTLVDYATVKYNSEGVRSWDATYDGPSSSTDNVRRIAVDDSGNVYVAGTSSVSDAGWSIYTTIKYEQSNQAPSAPILQQPFDRALISDTTPSLTFTVPEDQNGDQLHFGLRIGPNPAFEEGALTFESRLDQTGFSPTPPVASGSGEITYTLQSPLAAGNWWWDASAWDNQEYGRPAQARRFTVDSSKPLIVHTPISLAVASQSQTFAANISDNIGIKSSKLHYRPGGTFSYLESTMVHVGSESFRAEIPGDIVTTRGVEYYISVEDQAGNVATLPEMNAADSPLVIQVIDRNVTFPAPTPGLAYRMISVPADLDVSSPANVLQDELGDYDNTEWRLLRYVNGINLEYTVDTIHDFEPGIAFWLITRASTLLDAGPGKSVSTGQNYIIPLNPGWNQIGNPFAFPVAWHEVLRDTSAVEDNLVGYSGIVNEAEGYAHKQPQLIPWYGYFVRNRDMSESLLEIPPIETTDRAWKIGDDQRPYGSLADGEWALQITAECGRYLDDDNYIGCLEEANDAWDQNDFSEAPFFLSHVSLFFPHLDWQVYPGLYTGDFRSMNAEGHVWEFSVSTNAADSEVKLAIPSTDNLPRTWRLKLFDETQGNLVDQFEMDGYSFPTGSGETVRDFKIAAGTADFLAATSFGKRMTPNIFALSQNYPNPFNPKTQISYEVPRSRHVRIAVYNIMGQLIRTLVERVQHIGSYKVIWDGTDEAGNTVGSGIYLLRMHAGDFQATRKMLVVR